MSMECDTRLLMMTLRERSDRPARRRNTRVRRARNYVAAAPSAVAAFALTLFTRGV